MDWNEFTAQLMVVLVPVIAAGLAGLIGAVFAWLTAKVKKQFGDNATEKAAQYFTIMEDVAVNCVLAAQQMMVDPLKREGKWTAEVAKEVKAKTLAAALASLGELQAKIQAQLLIDVPAYMANLIEARLRDLKDEGVIPTVNPLTGGVQPPTA